jgi:hypothetical protein
MSRLRSKSNSFLRIPQQISTNSPLNLDKINEWLLELRNMRNFLERNKFDLRSPILPKEDEEDRSLPENLPETLNPLEENQILKKISIKVPRNQENFQGNFEENLANSSVFAEIY